MNLYKTSDKAAKASENNNDLALCKQLYKDIKDTRDPDECVSHQLLSNGNLILTPICLLVVKAGF